MVLGVAFAAAVWWRVHSYSEAEAAVPAVSGSSTTTGATTSGAARSTIEQPGVASSEPSDPGVVVEGTTASSLTAAESARERRYNELLRAGPPGAEGAAAARVNTAAAPPQERSLVTRIAEAVGIRQKPQATQSAPAPAPPPPPSQQSAKPSSPAAHDPAAHTESDDDPDSDVAAPQLINVEFLPSTVQDGETTLLAVTAQDNLSGVRSVSGVIASPTGTVQGFACQREADSNRFVTRITVPKEAAAGTWVMKYLTLTDNANNSVNLNAAQGGLPPTASFRVVASTSDTTAPTLKAVWLDRAAMRAGDRNTVFVQAEDEQTGVTSVNGVFVSPGKQARLAFGCHQGTTGAWECALSPPSCLDCGAWHLEQLQLQDKANNMATIRADNALLRPVVVDISGDACDSQPPALSMLLVSPPTVKNSEGGVIDVRATVADDGCGVASLSGQAVPQGNIGGQHVYFTLAPVPGDERTFVGKIEIQKHAAKGTWTIAWLQALDKGHNLRAYSASDPMIARVTFIVE